MGGGSFQQFGENYSTHSHKGVSYGVLPCLCLKPEGGGLHLGAQERDQLNTGSSGIQYCFAAQEEEKGEEKSWVLGHCQ